MADSKIQAEEETRTTLNAPNHANNRKSYQINLRWIIFSLPIISSLCSFIACLMAYIIGVNSGTLKPLPFIPYISDTGDFKPNSSIFTLFLILSSFATLVIAIVRFYQIAAEARCSIANRAALVSAFLFLLGKIVVSSFQLSSNIFVHFAAAGLYFLGATIYTLLQCYITYRFLGDSINKERFVKDSTWRRGCIVYLIRVVCCVGLVINLIIFGVFATIPSLEIHNRGGANVAQATEWALAAFKIIFLSTFTYDFWNIEFKFGMEFKTIQPKDFPSPETQVSIDIEDNIRLARYTRFDSKEPNKVKIEFHT
ncbi:modulator of macroautophagy TMEM150B-B-like isoform X1 [Clytia hemisphaerica]|uniref:CWH43-like N-terminal domain-containing protein n=1 Tax=Clytia hemisphaerica TaxID=252671 RepID=A0A7M5WZL1_9CNID